MELSYTLVSIQIILKLPVKVKTTLNYVNYGKKNKEQKRKFLIPIKLQTHKKQNIKDNY